MTSCHFLFDDVISRARDEISKNNNPPTPKAVGYAQLLIEVVGFQQLRESPRFNRVVDLSPFTRDICFFCSRALFLGLHVC